jgi:hypothetical protein
MDTTNLKLPVEIGFKPLNTKTVDIIIPAGFLFSWETYNQKNPSYTNNVPYDRTWKYHYIAVYSGLNLSVKLSHHFKLGLFSRIGYVFKKDYTYTAKLQGNYVWSDTGTNSYSSKSSFDAFVYSVGIGVRANL